MRYRSSTIRNRLRHEKPSHGTEGNVQADYRNYGDFLLIALQMVVQGSSDGFGDE